MTSGSVTDVLLSAVWEGIIFGTISDQAILEYSYPAGLLFEYRGEAKAPPLCLWPHPAP